MWRRGSKKGAEGDSKEKNNVIRTSKQLMVPEVRASVRERVSNLRPGGLPLPGKTTQGFKGSLRSSSRESAQPKSFRTVRNFWRRQEGGAEDTAPPRRFGPLKPIKKQEPGVEHKKPHIPDKPNAQAWKMPVLRKTPNARESAKRKSQRKSTEEIKKQSIARESAKKSLRENEETKRSSAKPGKISTLKKLFGRKSSEKVSVRKAPSSRSDVSLKSHKSPGRTTIRKSASFRSDASMRNHMSSGKTIASKPPSGRANVTKGSLRGSGKIAVTREPSSITDIIRRSRDIEEVSERFSAKGSTISTKSKHHPRGSKGTSALHIAVKEDNEDMVQLLLSLPGIEVRDSHLFAIRDNHSGILVMILDKLQSINPALEFMACSNSPEFAENITPLILAAEAGHFEIVGLLISRGHVIPRPHKPRCFCKEECQAIMKSQDILSISSGKLHIYRALSNPAYICQTSPDPLLIAFKLSKELLTCGHVDTIYMRQYEALAESLRTFAVEIIAECRTLEEVETILSESKDSNLKGNWTYPRLVLAMDYKQKEFIAHPNVQQVLERAWMGDWIAWRRYTVYVKALYIFPRLLTLPLVLGVLMFTPTSRWAKHFSLPVNKLLSNVASYCLFLLLVFIQSNVNKKDQTRETKPTGVEVFLVIYVLTFIYNSIRSLLKQGVRRFFKFMWNIYELVMEFFFIMAFVFLIAADIKTTIKGDKDEERKYWYYLDPELISESFFVLAAIMAFMRILLIFQISYHLGPLQVSLGKMTNDCAMYSVIFAIIILAFTVGLCRFYAYYEDMVQTNPETGEVESSQVNSFTSVLDTFKTLFWGLFGMSSFDVADVIVENIDDGSNNGTTTNEHHLTEAVGYFAFASYMILTVIVILNMLIATMSNTFQKVTDNLDIEWLFGRTEVYMCYIDLPVLPPPFNVIPTTHGLVSLVKGHKSKSGKLIGVDVEKGTVQEQDDRKNDDYYVLMSQLVQRYFSTKNSEND
ncbi:short transient receptor potential channel 4 isoform X2 [Halyomorpha halys]|uniref:short transient receptor potential channel 4 isoform X2 n=1 Tax=Halyomorpha halys TaxID=286706 RepID=UPI000D0C7C7E|nr:short transient receptor potential channel 4-like isoform X3 [Halyomorpha halys]